MNTIRFAVPALALATFAGAAFAQTQPKTTDPTLQGPAVTSGGVPGENRQFGDGKVKGKERMGTEIPHRLFMKALDTLRGSTADPSVRLSSDQDTKIKTINDAYMAQVTAYRQAHQDEAKQLIQQLSPEDRKKAMALFNRVSDGDGPAKLGKGKGKGAASTADTANQTVDPKQAEEAKAKLRELMQGAPKPGDTHAQIFAVLSDPQKVAFQKQLEAERKEMQERAGEKRAERKAAAKTAGAAKPAPSTNSDVNVPTPDKP
jgi:hypothetical protein